MELSDSRIEQYVNRMDDVVGHCYNCQPWEDGEMIWVRGNQTTLDELLSEYRVPEKYRETVASRLNCGNCGTPLSLWDDVGAKDSEEIAHEKLWDKWTAKLAPELESFGKHLSEYPYLGLAHKMGKRIHKDIETFPRVSLEDSIWWRARAPFSAKRPQASDMLPPPPAAAKSEGRFNHFGQVAFYLASQQFAALSEALDASEGEVVAWLQKYRIQGAGDLLDLRSPGYPDEIDLPVLTVGLATHLPDLQPEKASPWKPEYFVPRFIADCAKARGFRGILFHSRKHINDNLVLFKWDDIRLRRVGKPRLCELSASDEKTPRPRAVKDERLLPF